MIAAAFLVVPNLLNLLQKALYWVEQYYLPEHNPIFWQEAQRFYCGRNWKEI